MASILYSKIATMHIMALIDTELICLEHTLIELRSNLHISIKTEVRTHIVRILIFLSQQIPLLRVYEVLIKLILLTIALIHLVTFHLMIYVIKSHHWCNLCTKCIYNWTKLYVFHICGGHFEYSKLLKGGNVPHTWNCLLRPYRSIIKKEKNFIIQFYPDPAGCRTILVFTSISFNHSHRFIYLFFNISIHPSHCVILLVFHQIVRKKNKLIPYSLFVHFVIQLLVYKYKSPAPMQW